MDSKKKILQFKNNNFASIEGHSKFLTFVMPKSSPTQVGNKKQNKKPVTCLQLKKPPEGLRAQSSKWMALKHQPGRS